MRKLTGFLCIFLLVFTMAVTSHALVFEYDEGGYVVPDGNNQIAQYKYPLYLPEYPIIYLNHSNVVKWTINDVSMINDLPDQEEYLNVVFHGIYNGSEPDADN